MADEQLNAKVGSIIQKINLVFTSMPSRNRLDSARAGHPVRAATYRIVPNNRTAERRPRPSSLGQGQWRS